MSQTKTQLVDGFNINTSVPADSLVIDSSGNVGLGTSSPGSKLHVSGDYIQVDNGYGLTTVGGLKYIADSDNNAPSAGALHNFFTDNGTTSALAILKSGNVGIGTTTVNANAILHTVGGNILVQGDGGANTASLILSPQSTPADGVAISVSYSGSGSYGPLTFVTGGSESARIDSSGRLLVGTTTPTALNTGLVLNGAVKWAVGPGFPSGTTFYVYNDSGVGVYLSSGGTSWTGSSDINLKYVTGEIMDGLNKVYSLRAAEFTWKNDPNNTPRVGLIAQDVQQVLPEVIDEDNGFLGIRYTEVIPLLVAALKESKERIETLEAEMAALKAS